jgi:hypothetical protein
LQDRATAALGDKLLRKEKFASEIFGRRLVFFYVAVQNKFTFLCGPMSNRRRINSFRIVRVLADAPLGSAAAGGFRINNL